MSVKELQKCLGDLGVVLTNEALTGALGVAFNNSITFKDFATMLFRLNRGEVQGGAGVYPMVPEVDSETAGRISVTQCARRWVWKTFDDPSFSLLAKAIAAWIMFLIALSCVAFILESYRPLHKTGEPAWNRMEVRRCVFPLRCTYVWVLRH